MVLRTVIGMLLVLSSPILAMDAISSRSDFTTVIDGNTLVLRLYGIRLNVNTDGTITGRALGRDVTGDWAWKDGYFCRTMFWGKREIPYNCQLVEIDGNRVRFTTDQGVGDSADFVIRQKN